MSYSFPTTDDRLDGIFSAQALPMSIVAWVWRDPTAWNDTSNKFISMLITTDGDSEDSIRLTCCRTGTNRVGAGATDSGGSDFADETFADTTYDSIWVPVIGVFLLSGDERTVYVENFTNSDTDTGGNTAFDDLTIIRVGCNHAGFNFFSQNGAAYIAEVAIFDVVLDEDEINAIQTSPENGPAPNTIRPDSCVGYWPMLLDQTTHVDQSGNSGPDLTVQSGAAWNTEHPTIASSPVIITDVDGDETWNDGDTTLIITGTGFV